MKHQLLKLLTSVIIASFVMAACGGQPTAAPTTVPPTAAATAASPATAVPPTVAPTPAPKPVTITVWDYYGDTTPIKPLVAAFEAKNPNIKVQIEALGWDGFWQKLSTATAGGEGADVVTTGLMWAPQYKALGAYADVMPLSKGQINGQPIDKVFPKPLLDAAREGDKLYGVPYDFDAYALYYRKDVYDTAGITDVPKTWDAFMAANQKLTKAPNQYGTSVTAYWSHFDPYLYAFGGQYFDANGKSTINSPKAVKALQFMVDMTTKKAAVNWTSDMGDFTSGLKSGQVVSFINGPWMMGVLRKAAPEMSGKWRVAMVPSGEAFGTHIGGTHLAILEKSKHKAEAWAFVEFLMRPENQAKVWTISGAAPAYLPALDLPEVTAGDPYFGGQSTLGVFRGTVEKGIPNPTIKQWGDVSNIVTKTMEIALLGKKTPKDALDDAAKQIDALTGK